MPELLGAYLAKSGNNTYLDWNHFCFERWYVSYHHVDIQTALKHTPWQVAPGVQS